MINKTLSSDFVSLKNNRKINQPLHVTNKCYYTIENGALMVQYLQGGWINVIRLQMKLSSLHS